MALPYRNTQEPRLIQRNVEWLTGRVVDFVGSVLGIRFGTTTLTWPGSAQASDFPTIRHGLGRAPRVAWGFGIGGLSAGTPWAIVTTFTYTATTFILQAKTHDESSPAAGTTCLVGWVALG